MLYVYFFNLIFLKQGKDKKIYTPLNYPVKVKFNRVKIQVDEIINVVIYM